jgi:hypothetical protein
MVSAWIRFKAVLLPLPHVTTGHQWQLSCRFSSQAPSRHFKSQKTVVMASRNSFLANQGTAAVMSFGKAIGEGKKGNWQAKWEGRIL